MQGKEHFEKSGRKMLDDKRIDRLENLKRKYLFYVKNKDRGYMIPEDMKKLFDVSQEGTSDTNIGPAVLKIIEKTVDSEMKTEQRKFEEEVESLKDRTLPPFLRSDSEF